VGSVCGYSLLALVIYCNKELQIHPMKMFMVMALVDAATCLVIMEANDICKLSLYKVFAATVYFSTDPYAQYRATWILIAAKNFAIVFLMLLSNMLNTCLAVDLILMIKHPFKVKEKRFSLYIWFSVCASVLICAAWVLTFDYRFLKTYNELWPVPSFYVAIFTTVVMGAYFVIAIVSVIYAIKQLCRPGISRSSRNIVFLRHVLSIVGFIFA
jgi:hypothetical protein